MTSQDQIFHDLLAEREIHRVLLRYCRGVDRADEAVIAACFHPDARDDHGNWLADGASVARHIVDVIRPGTARAMHFMGNALIEVEGDTAFAESYILAFRAFDRDGVAHNRTRAVRFIDRFERRDAQWRISERVVVDAVGQPEVRVANRERLAGNDQQLVLQRLLQEFTEAGRKDPKLEILDERFKS